MLKIMVMISTVVAVVVGRTVIIGDDILANPVIDGFLQNRTGHVIVNYAVNNARFHEGWVKSMYEQFEDISSLNIDTVIMSGGRNDVLPQCTNMTEACIEKVDETIDLFMILLNSFFNHNVENVFYIGNTSRTDDVLYHQTRRIRILCQNIRMVNCHYIEVSYNLGQKIWDTSVQSGITL